MALGLLGVLAGAMILLHFSQDLPAVETARDLEMHQPLRVFARDGTLIGEFGAERREPLAWENVPDVLVDAFLAAEDDRFYSHPGFDYQGLIRAAWVLLTTGDKSQGGSTITMQLARNLFLSSEKSYTRKIREILLAMQLERAFDKTEILRLYLNKIYLGQRAYGVAAAARIYYGKQVEELRLDEAAMIAGLPKAPSAYNPVSNPRRARIRRDYVLGRMHDLEMITPEAYAEALAAPVSDKLAPKPVTLDAHYVAEMVRGQMHSRYGDAIYTAGVEVDTTIDATLQRAAAAAVRDGVLDYDARHGWRGPAAMRELPANTTLEALQAEDTAARLVHAQELLEDIPTPGGLRAAIVIDRADAVLTVLDDAGALVPLTEEQIPWSEARALDPGAVVHVWRRDDERWYLAQIPEVQAAMVAIDPQTGALRAVVGGFDFFLSKFNRATQSLRQPGSAFKPFLYSAGLDAGLTTATIINDAPVVFDDPALGGAWRPENYDRRFRGPTRVREALVRSSNLVTIRILQEVGVQRFRDYVRRFGLGTSNLPRDLSIALGSGTYSPQDIAMAYAVIANGGWQVDPWFIGQVRDGEGMVVEQHVPMVVCPSCADDMPMIEPTPLPAPALPGDAPDVSPANTVVDAPEPRAAPRVADAANMYIVADMMRDVIQRGTGRAARALGRLDIAGKTGTTNEQRDAWFAGFHPQLAVVAWVGFDELQPLGAGETGGRAALPIWIDFMEQALPGLPEQLPVMPAGVVRARIDPDTGRLSSAGSFELFLEGHMPDAEPVSAWPVGPGEISDTEANDSTDAVLEDLY